MVFNAKKYRDGKIYSQCGQDTFVLDYFKNKKNGVFVDIGASNGISFSNTYELEKEYGWTGICFEPNPMAFEKLEKNRSCIKVMKAVSNVIGVEKFTIANLLSGLTKEYDVRHVQRIDRTKQWKEEIDVECVLLCDILEEYGIYSVDYLNMDTEGNEFKILKTIDFSKFNIELLTIENNYNDINQTNFLLSKGYKLIGKLGGDEIFSKIK